MTIKPILTLVCLCGAALQLTAGESPSTPATPGANLPAATAESTPAVNDGGSSKAVSADDLNQLRQRIAKQEEEIKRLQQSVEEQRVLLERAVQNSSGSPALADGSSQTGAEPSNRSRWSMSLIQILRDQAEVGRKRYQSIHRRCRSVSETRRLRRWVLSISPGTVVPRTSAAASEPALVGFPTTTR